MSKNILSDLMLEGENLPNKLVKRVQRCQDQVEIIQALNNTRYRTNACLKQTQDGLSEDLQYIKENVSARCYEKHFSELEDLCRFDKYNF